jgi:hypothetical protein
MTLTAAALVATGLLGIGSATHADPVQPAPSQNLRTPSQRFATQNKADEPSFRRDVIPLLARAGCSARECHGSFQGRGGFQLSLFGSEWDHDFVQLTQSKGDEDEVHIDLANPEKSLILLKPTVQVKHKGKERFKKDSWQYNMILQWIRDGAKNDADKTGELARLEIVPSEIVFSKAGQVTQLRVLAHWDNGTVQDVTELTRFKTNDETVANVSDNGLVACTGKGDSHIVISYDNGVVPIPIMLPVSEFAGEKFPSVPTRTKVDALVLNKLRKMGIVPSPVCSDSEFLRRVSLDLTGTLPTPDAVVKFLADPSSGKRAAKIEELLNTPAYAAWWTTKFCDYTGDSPTQLNIGNNNVYRNPGEISRQWYDWIYRRIANNVAYDQIVADIVLATSRSSPNETYKDYSLEMDSYYRKDNPKSYADHPTLAYFWQRRNVTLPQDKALSFAHAFMGVRIECAQCHKHPFDRWTKKDFEQFTAFFNSVAANPRTVVGEEPNYRTVYKDLYDKAEADVKAREKSADGKRDPTQMQRIQREARDESLRRINANELVPWEEVWINTKAVRSGGKKSVKIDPSIKPKLLGGEEIAPGQYPDPRQALMGWLREKNNPYFAKAFVNRVWGSYFSRGIVNPVDDLNLANAPSNADLLNYLADGFMSHNYDMKWLHREILNSDTYQRSWKTNPTNELDARNFSHSVVRQLPAEVMLDAIDMAIGPEQKMNGYLTETDERAIGPVGTALYSKPGKAAKGGDGYFLNLFGKPAREANCDCERSTDPTLLQTLFTENDPQLLGRIEGYGGGGGSWVAELRKSKTKQIDTDKVISETFLRTVSRPPTQLEISEAKTDIAAAKTPIDGVRDLLWAMINTREFKVNH